MPRNNRLTFLKIDTLTTVRPADTKLKPLTGRVKRNGVTMACTWCQIPAVKHVLKYINCA
ncbi:hypothetical protein [Klebsiella pneumoniae IS10]|nr:hypothetical protein [Klebsiella pneumoniae IS10]